MNNLLEEKIKESGYKLYFIAEQLGITYVALHNKLDGKNAFTLNEAIQLKYILNMTEEEWRTVFEDGIVSASN